MSRIPRPAILAGVSLAVVAAASTAASGALLSDDGLTVWLRVSPAIAWVLRSLAFGAGVAASGILVIAGWPGERREWLALGLGFVAGGSCLVAAASAISSPREWALLDKWASLYLGPTSLVFAVVQPVALLAAGSRKKLSSRGKTIPQAAAAGTGLALLGVVTYGLLRLSGSLPQWRAVVALAMVALACPLLVGAGIAPTAPPRSPRSAPRVPLVAAAFTLTLAVGLVDIWFKAVPWWP